MKRIVAIDILRGFALMGILVMNIMSFAMPDTAYYNPAAFGGDEWFNQLTYAVVHVMADQKFMALFSLLFGASVMLIINNLESKGEKTARFHYVRNFWLLIFGIVHATYIWAGDILMIYAACSFVLYFMRKLAPKWQFTLGLIIFLLPALGYIIGYEVVGEMPASDIATLESYWAPSDAELNAEIDYYLGNETDSAIAWGEAAGPAIDVYDVTALIEFFTRAFGMMLMGMALFSWGVITAQFSDQFYRRMVLTGFGIGVPIAALGVWFNSANNWAALESVFIGRIPNLIATPFVAAGYIGLVMLWSRSEIWAGLQQRLAAAGRMALTNYIAQSIIGTFIFYGFGLGMYGSLNRLMLLPVVVIIWAIQLWYSPLWLRYFRYGPLEWLWRSLSHWKIQPIRRHEFVGSAQT
ncbi:MAG: DUF418 domain-containing protein [Chloroflexota bacterium]